MGQAICLLPVRDIAKRLLDGIGNSTWLELPSIVDSPFYAHGLSKARSTLQHVDRPRTREDGVRKVHGIRSDLDDIASSKIPASREVTGRRVAAANNEERKAMVKTKDFENLSYPPHLLSGLERMER